MAAEPIEFPASSGTEHPEPEPDKYAGMDIVDSGDDVNYDEARPKPISAASLRGDAPKRFIYNCHQTSIQRGEKVQVVARMVNLTDRAQYGLFSAEVREIVQRLYFTADTANQKKDPPKIRMEKQLKRLEEMGHAYGVAGFVEPKFCLREQDEDAEKGIAWIGRIALHDLTEFSRICEGDEALAARRLEPFPD
jgi:hypothetical protein